MHNHAPEHYECPFCRVAKKDFTNPAVYTNAEDVILQTPLATVFLSSHWWPNNLGHVLIIPNKHFENIYDLPLEYATEIHRLSQQIALAFKAVYTCDGVSTRQHNEPVGNQEVWHYHLHVFPRYQGDDLYTLFLKRRLTTPDERLPYAQKLRDYFSQLDS
jgi:histidine triad (HIT) family protein